MVVALRRKNAGQSAKACFETRSPVLGRLQVVIP